MAKPTALERQLAELAHTLWCQQMIRDGWTGGRTYQPSKKIHDAIRPFARLNKADQRQAILGLRVSDIPDTMARSVDYARVPVPELGPKDVRVGTEVQFAQSPDLHGVVVGIERDPEWPGCLRTIRVRWSSGETTSHLAPECELAVCPPGSTPKRVRGRRSSRR